MKNAFDILQERGFIAQVTDEAALKECLGQNKMPFYVGFDPTAASLHVGSLVPIMAMMHMQRQGHVPILLLGGGTALIGDPSGKTEMRQLLNRDQIDHNARCLQNQLSRFIDFNDHKALLLNNAEWLTKLNYIDFLRDIGKHFSVNKMLAAESYKIRLEKGLNLIEFNYMLLQAYDFLYLFDHYACRLQMGGNDQWGNILAGIDLIRRIRSEEARGITFPLLVTARGQKMGKTEKGAVWLDPALTSPYDYYQYWINTDDADVERFLGLFTFLPPAEVKEASRLADAELNMAKAVLAFEATQIAHGPGEAQAAFAKSAQLFGLRSIPTARFRSSTIPRAAVIDNGRPDFSSPSLSASGTSAPIIERERLAAGISAFELFHETKLCASRGAARRLIAQGGGYVNDRQICDGDEKITAKDVNELGKIIIRKGKKSYAVLDVV